MSKEKEMKQHLQQYDKDTLIELYLQKDFDVKQQLADLQKDYDDLMLTSVDHESYYETINDLQQQLAEKDKEIEEYNKYFKSFGCKDFAEFQELIGLTKMSANDKVRDDMLRHQICEKIREKAKWSCPNDLKWTIKARDLDRIEKGE